MSNLGQTRITPVAMNSECPVLRLIPFSLLSLSITLIISFSSFPHQKPSSSPMHKCTTTTTTINNSNNNNILRSYTVNNNPNNPNNSDG